MTQDTDTDFIEAPVAKGWDPEARNFLENHVTCFDRSLQHTGKSNIKMDACFLAQSGSAQRVIQPVSARSCVCVCIMCMCVCVCVCAFVCVFVHIFCDIDRYTSIDVYTYVYIYRYVYMHIHMKESCHTYEEIMSHLRTSHATHTQES